mmetsp:Transcript_14721/g.22204  ORF Transcript_14721/g.22204 Transcript_14721/m.22204 type:complete len:323 (+) Transcript_14721:36-1004(+)
MASFFDAFVGKFSKEHREELSDFHNVSWEEDNAVSSCRCCGNDFNLTLRKHHCRGCGGIYCENCAPNNQQLPGIPERIRACLGCRLGETPGNIVRQMAKEMEAANRSTMPVLNAQPIPLYEGSLYGEDEEAAFKRADRMAAHQAGYFQLTNKTDSICAVRVVVTGGDVYRECSKPSYKAVLPHESVYAEFPPTVPGLDVMILHTNSHLTPRGGCSIIYDPRAPNVRVDDIAPCARIENFNEVAVHRVMCHQKNCIVKYKGFGHIESRQGTKTKIKKGFASILMGRSSSGTVDDASAYTMDFKTNVSPEEMENIYASAGSGKA